MGRGWPDSAGRLVDHMRETADLGLVPEGIVDRLADDPTALLHEHVLDMAGFSGMLGDTIVGPAFLAGDANEAVRYWAITALGSRDRMLDGAGRTRVIVAEAAQRPFSRGPGRGGASVACCAG